MSVSTDLLNDLIDKSKTFTILYSTIFIFKTFDIVTNFDKLFDDDKLRQRHRSCSRSEKIFDRTDKNIFTPTSSTFPSPLPVSSCQTPCGSSYRVVERSCPKTFLEKLTRRPEKSSRQIAEEVRSEVLQICCDPCRPLPGYLDIVTQGQRLELGIDCDEVSCRVATNSEYGPNTEYRIYSFLKI